MTTVASARGGGEPYGPQWSASLRRGVGGATTAVGALSVWMATEIS